jgi:hypothetical protein
VTVLTTDELVGAAEAISAGQPLAADIHGDHEGGQRVITRVGLLPREHGGWLAAAAGHRNVDREDPS